MTIPRSLRPACAHTLRVSETLWTASGRVLDSSGLKGIFSRPAGGIRPTGWTTRQLCLSACRLCAQHKRLTQPLLLVQRDPLVVNQQNEDPPARGKRHLCLSRAHAVAPRRHTPLTLMGIVRRCLVARVSASARLTGERPSDRPAASGLTRLFCFPFESAFCARAPWPDGRCHGRYPSRRDSCARTVRSGARRQPRHLEAGGAARNVI
jgi:hypothetical protein